ncbi:MAG TPA: glycosyltransferase family A protein [Steroidobacteraceae bacterium]|nr:glycosyltransferase family A protein [Steroidobacteraceae bacterium]
MPGPNPVVITPYYKEEPALLRRCLDSVRAQTVPTDHLLVADGHAQAWIDAEPVRHLKLDRAHGDYGNTPRGIGALLAASEGAPAILLLDADNWLEPDHVQRCLQVAAATPGTDFVATRRSFRRLDGSLMPIEEEPAAGFIDTSCYAFFPGSYQLLGLWALMPKQMSAVGDRVFALSLGKAGLSGIAITDRATVNYHCLWEAYYRGIGEVPPAQAKPTIDAVPVFEWWRSLGAREREVLRRMTGISEAELAAAVNTSTARITRPA